MDPNPKTLRGANPEKPRCIKIGRRHNLDQASICEESGVRQCVNFHLFCGLTLTLNSIDALVINLIPNKILCSTVLGLGFEHQTTENIKQVHTWTDTDTQAKTILPPLVSTRQWNVPKINKKTLWIPQFVWGFSFFFSFTTTKLSAPPSIRTLLNHTSNT